MTFLPHRRLNIVILTLGAALVAASCGVSRDVATSTAATITFSDGSTAEISSDDIEPIVSSIESNDEFVALIYPDGDTSGLEADVLTQAIGAELITHAAESAAPRSTTKRLPKARRPPRPSWSQRSPRRTPAARPRGSTTTSR